VSTILYSLLARILEHRGVGGLFFDDLVLPAEELSEFLLRLVDSFLASYRPILDANRDMAYCPEQKRWMNVRRGRYIEFNLALDRGVRFGLGDPARTDSILISAPPSVEWIYRYPVEEGSPEAEVVQLLSEAPREWC
jgi:coproporphyrinogen III oxidase